ncbi:MAG: ArsC family reductase [Endozoicomonas sp.]
MITLFGIPNCDTIKKARRWLDSAGIDYRFHDYRKHGLEQKQLESWVDELGWESVLNRRGTTWRKLSDDQKNTISRESAITLMLEQPAMIKRPLLDTGEEQILGFSEDLYKQTFAPNNS